MDGGEIMAYKESIVKKIIEIVEIAPKGTSTHYLEGFNQKDVIDTVNSLHLKYPDNILETESYYSELVPIVINK